MADDDETWTIGDSDGKTIAIRRRGGDVLLEIGPVYALAPPVTVRLGGMKRDLFDRCYQEAERRAEAHEEVSG